ncbi:MAG: hypothetical protein ACMUJM_05780 [bacterium]
MKKYWAIMLSCCCFLLIIIIFSPHIQAYLVDPNEIVFNIRSEGIVTDSEQICRATFSIYKGDDVYPVCLSTTVSYDTQVFDTVREVDIDSDYPALENKDISIRLDEEQHGIIGIMIGVEVYNDLPLTDGDLFSIDFKVKPGATPTDNSIAICIDPNIGPNQASNSMADALDVNVVRDLGALWSNSNGATEGWFDDKETPRHYACFIEIVYGDILYGLSQ